MEKHTWTSGDFQAQFEKVNIWGSGTPNRDNSDGCNPWEGGKHPRNGVSRDTAGGHNRSSGTRPGGGPSRGGLSGFGRLGARRANKRRRPSGVRTPRKLVFLRAAGFNPPWGQQVFPAIPPSLGFPVSFTGAPIANGSVFFDLQGFDQEFLFISPIHPGQNPRLLTGPGRGDNSAFFTCNGLFQNRKRNCSVRFGRIFQ